MEKIKPILKYFTEKEHDIIYTQWLTKKEHDSSVNLWKQIERHGSKQELNEVNTYINWRYYIDHPIIIRDDDAGNHVNLMKEIGEINYITCSTYWICLRRNIGKTTDSIINWLLKRWIFYKERGAYIRRRDNDLKSFLQEMKKEFFITLEPLGFKFDKGAIIEIQTGEPVISFRSLTGQVNSSSTFAHTNIVYDEPIAIKSDLILNEKDLLMQLNVSLFRDRIPVGRLLLLSNANHLRTPLLDDLFMDLDSFKKTPKQVIKTPYGSKIFMFLGFNIKQNRINSNFHNSPVGAFMTAAQYDFLENGTFAFDNQIYQWSIKNIVVTHYHAVYVLREHKFVEVSAINKKTKEKKLVFMNFSQIPKNQLENIHAYIPLFVLQNGDIVENLNCSIIPDPEALILKWFRGTKNDKYRFTSNILPIVFQEILRKIPYGGEIKNTR